MKKIYLVMSADVIHTGHINIVKKAASLGDLTVGVYSDQVCASIDRYPVLPVADRMEIIRNLKGVNQVIEQDSIGYRKVLTSLKPDIVVHGDEWKNNHMRDIRAEVLQILKEYGGELVEFPYSHSENIERLERFIHDKLAVPEVRRPRLKKLLQEKRIISIMEAHSGLSGLIVEKTKVETSGEIRQFDGMWISSLCDSTMKGKPDIELVDFTSRQRTIDEIMEVTSKPIILDCDSGGLPEHFEYNIRTLERIGVSAAIIEDKVGLKKNSLLGSDGGQSQDSIENFCYKIRLGKKALRTNELLLIARVESLILNQGMDDALKRAIAYVDAGADGIMIHSCKKEPAEIFEFCEKFRKIHALVPIVLVPTTFNSISEDEWYRRGANIIIHANHLLRSAFPAMSNTAKSILSNRRSLEADQMCMSIKEILELIPPLS